jgi:hypothetical protein
MVGASGHLHISWVSFHYRAAFFTRSQFQRPVKIPETGKKIFLNVIEMELIFVKLVIAFFTKPDKAIVFIGIALAFDHQTNRIWSSDR